MNILQIIDAFSHFIVDLVGLALVAVAIYGLMLLAGNVVQSVVQRRKLRAMRAAFGIAGSAGKPIAPRAAKRSHRKAA